MSDQTVAYNDNKAIPRLRYYELNENSSRYDQMAAAPSDEMLVYYWYTWALLAFLVGLFSFLVFLSVLMKRKVRRKPFNLYLLYLLIPDFVFSISCGITCFLNALTGHYYSKLMCNVQQWYCVFGIGGSAWVNAIIAFQIHMMLKDSHARRRYRVPSCRSVTLQCLAAFAWVIFLGSWGVYEDSNFPFHSGLISGLACLPTEVDRASSLFFWLVFVPLFVGIPTIYAIWVSFDIYRRKLLPPTGKRRLLSIYFGRLLLVFCAMWIPAITLLFILPSFTPSWVSFLGGTWSHLQTFLSAGVICMKPDIQQAFKDFLCCRRGGLEESADFDTLASRSVGLRTSTGSRLSTSANSEGRYKYRDRSREEEEAKFATASSDELDGVSQDISLNIMDDGHKERTKAEVKSDEFIKVEDPVEAKTETSKDFEANV